MDAKLLGVHLTVQVQNVDSLRRLSAELLLPTLPYRRRRRGRGLAANAFRHAEDVLKGRVKRCEDLSKFGYTLFDSGGLLALLPQSLFRLGKLPVPRVEFALERFDLLTGVWQWVEGGE